MLPVHLDKPQNGTPTKLTIVPLIMHYTLYIKSSKFKINSSSHKSIFTLSGTQIFTPKSDICYLVIKPQNSMPTFAWVGCFAAKPATWPCVQISLDIGRYTYKTLTFVCACRSSLGREIYCEVIDISSLYFILNDWLSLVKVTNLWANLDIGPGQSQVSQLDSG